MHKVLDLFYRSAKQLRSPTAIAVCALLTSLCVVFDQATIMISPVMHITFSFICIAMMGLLYGPVVGALGAGVCDILKFIIFPKGPFHPGFTLSAILIGFIYGLVLYQGKDSLWRLTLSTVLVKLLINTALNAWWLYGMYDKAFGVIVWGQFCKNSIMAPIESLILFGFCKLLRTTDLWNRLQ